MRSFLDTNGEVLAMLDPSVKLEVSWYNIMFSGGAKRRLQEHVLELLPTEVKPGNAQQSVVAIDALR